MHDAGPHACAAIWKLLKVKCECVRERAAVNSSSGMNDQTGWLVYDDERVVFVDDLDRNIFRSETRRSGRDEFDFEFVVFA